MKIFFPRILTISFEALADVIGFTFLEKKKVLKALPFKLDPKKKYPNFNSPSTTFRRKEKSTHLCTLFKCKYNKERSILELNELWVL